MQQIAEWLEKLGMSEYAERFTENGISVAALRHLTDQDLKDIGVLLGHRRIMLAAIGDLAGASGTAETSAAASKPRGTPTALNKANRGRSRTSSFNLPSWLGMDPEGGSATWWGAAETKSAAEASAALRLNAGAIIPQRSGRIFR